MWCWHHIRENLNGLCPACRTPYNADPHAFSAVDRQEIIKRNREQRAVEKKAKKIEASQPMRSQSTPAAPVSSTNGIARQTSDPAPSKPAPGGSIDRRHLHNYRVVQRNLMYVTGLPSTCSSEEMLRRAEYFGAFFYQICAPLFPLSLLFSALFDSSDS